MTISACGIDCDKCSFFIENKCPGCRKAASLGKCVWGGRCELYDCADSQKLPHCGKCAKFPCDKLEEWASGENSDRIVNLVRENQIEAARNNFIRASCEMGFTFISPYRLDESLPFTAFGFIPEYGSKKGAVISVEFPPDFEMDDALIEWCHANGFFWSGINIEPLAGEYNPEYFR